MILRQLHLESFRSYASAELTFSPGLNLILGENARGKTNLIESIWCLSGARSFRTARDAEMVRFGEKGFRIDAALESRRREYTVSMQYAGMRRVKLNGVAKKKLSEAFGAVQCVLFCPEDLELVKGGPAQRRKFMDNALCQLKPGYAAALTRYQRLQAQLTKILGDDTGAYADALDTFAYQLCCVGARILPYRHAFVQSLAKSAARFHGDISSGHECLQLGYQAVTGTDPTATAPDIGRQLWEHYQSHRAAMLSARQLLTGPHKDDISLFLTTQGENACVDARKFASQGQARTAALALKLAERQLFYENTGEYPILLLDDVLSELDASRKRFLLEKIREGQIFVTSCEETGDFGDAARFRVESGRIVREE